MHDEYKQQQIQKFLDEQQSGINYIELHALVTGYICGDGNPRPDIWIPAICAADFKSTELNELYTDIEEELSSLNFTFALPIPADNNPLVERAKVFVRWIKEFLTGIGLSGCNIISLDSPDMQEAIQDLSSISQMNTNDIIEDDDSEASFIELEEFVRSVVMFIYNEVRQGSGDRNLPN